MKSKQKIPNWTETKWYSSNYDGQFKIYINHQDGWESAILEKNNNNDLSDLGFMFENPDGYAGATSISLEEAKDLHQKIGEYIRYMEG